MQFDRIPKDHQCIQEDSYRWDYDWPLGNQHWLRKTQGMDPDTFERYKTCRMDNHYWFDIQVCIRCRDCPSNLADKYRMQTSLCLHNEHSNRKDLDCKHLLQSQVQLVCHNTVRMDHQSNCRDKNRWHCGWQHRIWHWFHKHLCKDRHTWNWYKPYLKDIQNWWHTRVCNWAVVQCILVDKSKLHDRSSLDKQHWLHMGMVGMVLGLVL